MHTITLISLYVFSFTLFALLFAPPMLATMFEGRRICANGARKALFAYWWKAPLMVTVIIVTYILAPLFALYSVIFNRKTLPGFLSNFHTTLVGLDGGVESGFYPIPNNILERWWVRTQWIWRNPATGFTYKVFGFNEDGLKIIYKDTYQRTGWDWPVDGPSKELLIVENAAGQRAFSVRYHLLIAGKQTYADGKPSWKGTRFLRLWAGWKTAINYGKAFGYNNQCPLTATVHPWRRSA